MSRQLRGWLSGKPADARLWPGSWASSKQAGMMVRSDLARARTTWLAESRSDTEQEQREASSFLAYCDEDNRYVDFHALRHSFISRLVKAGVSPKEAQALARHSTITFTMDRYSHVGLHDLTSGIAALPSLPSLDSMPQQ